ncbi:hypothetical protein B0F90DRAFT_1757859 [Multifurca ochricompacta]|uniref:Uncharacterized protein n=1 Tax=Multifurca ochricompacta TaxID=376703 RepID=A0AAD4LYA7_9AGAM|nr:hypothetical protein B0F90DRAFT_1757859 [Multifurca ochricompacta]
MSSDQHRSHHRGSSRYAHRAMGDVAYAPSSASSSDNSDRGTHSNYSSSRRVLAHVLARKERDSKQMHQLLKLTFSKLDEESRRATDAERRTAECLVRARTAIDARAQADADAAAARAEVSLYKMQLEQAQREIFRAQEMLDGLEARRHDAEEDAARARSVARKMQEERAIEAAREEGKQQGWREGLRRGMILGRQEAEDELRSRRREDDLPRSRSRRRRLEETLFSQVAPDLPEQSSSEGSSPDDVPPRGTSGTRNGSRRTPEIAPLTPAPAVPRRAAPFRSSSPSRPFGRGPEPASRRHNEQTSDSPELSQSRQRSRSRPRMETPVPEPAHSRPYTPHDDSTPSIIQPIPVLPPRHQPNSSHAGVTEPHTCTPPPVQIPPDNWIPRAQDAAGDGHLSIFLPHHTKGPYAITATPEEGSPAVVPPPPDLSPSPGTPGTMRRSPPEYAYVMPPPPPPPPDLGPAVRTPRHSRSRDYAYATSTPDFGPAVPISRLPMTTQRSRDYVNVNAPLPPPPPPDLGPAVSHQPLASNHSRASTHLSEFDLLAPVEQPRGVSAIGKGRAARGTIGPPPAEEEELEYVDAVTEPIPRQPIAHHSNLNSNPNPPLLQRRRAYECR